jgi:hypothetical protein
VGITGDCRSVLGHYPARPRMTRRHLNPRRTQLVIATEGGRRKDTSMAKHKRREKPNPVLGTQTSPRGRTFLLSGMMGLALVAGVAAWFFLQRPASTSFAVQSTGGPRLAVDKELIDFGPVQFERTVSARFRLRNVGDQALRLAVDPRVEAIEGC